MIVNIVDAVNLERNLYLTTHLLEMNVPMLLIINMKDVAETRDISIDVKALSAKLGIPVEYISAISKNALQLVITAVDKASSVKVQSKESIKITYENEVETIISELIAKLNNQAAEMQVSPRWLSIKLLEGSSSLLEKLQLENSEEIEIYRDRIEKEVGDEADILIADARYGFIHGLMVSSVKKGAPRKTITDKIDKFVLNRFLGIPIFLVAMYLIFWVTINLGGAFIDFFDITFGSVFVDGSAFLLDKLGSPAWINAIISTGIGGGLQTLATFVPIMFMLFFMLALLEDSGYMARAAFVMDRFMRYIGLPGKAFIPMLVGFGCTVPAITATRTLANKRDRYLTIFMTPFMSCGARLPVYALFAAAFFPKNGQMIVFALYMTGILLAIFTGLLLKKTLFAGESAPLLMELPLYHTPRLHHIFMHTWMRLKGFVLKAGKFLILIVAVLGVLNSLYSSAAAEGEVEEEGEYDLWASLGEAVSTIPDNLAGAFDPAVLRDPLGTNIGDVSDSSAVAEDMEIENSIFGEMRSRFAGGPAAAFAYLLFILLYVPCLVAVAAMYKEIGLIFTVFQMVYSTVLAWVVATLFYQVTVGHSVLFIGEALLLLAILIAGINYYGKKTARKQQYA